MLPMEGIREGKEDEEEEDEVKNSSLSSVDALARRDAAFRLPAPSGELAPLGAPLNDRGPPPKSLLAPTQAFAAPVLHPGLL